MPDPRGDLRSRLRDRHPIVQGRHTGRCPAVNDTDMVSRRPGREHANFDCARIPVTYRPGTLIVPLAAVAAMSTPNSTTPRAFPADRTARESDSLQTYSIPSWRMIRYCESRRVGWCRQYSPR